MTSCESVASLRSRNRNEVQNLQLAMEPLNTFVEDIHWKDGEDLLRKC